VAQTADKSVEYSLQTTALNALFLVVSRDAKYKAKAVIDTFVVRFGEVCGALAIWVGVHSGIPVRGFAALNLVLGGVWVLVALRVGTLHRIRAGEQPARPLAVPARPAAAIPVATTLPVTNLLVK